MYPDVVAERLGVASECRQPHVECSRLEARNCRLRRAHSRCDLCLGKPESLSAQRELRTELALTLGHLLEAGEASPARCVSHPRLPATDISYLRYHTCDDTSS